MNRPRIKIGNARRGSRDPMPVPPPDYDTPVASHQADGTLGWTVTTQPPQFLIELCNSDPPQPESQSLVGGDQRVYAGLCVIWARVTSADAGGNPLSSPGEWIYFPENL